MKAPIKPTSEDNYGLMYANGTAKPAYYTLQHLMQIVHDTGSPATLKPLNYAVNVTVPAAYQKPGNQPDTVLHLLLQKADGSYEILLWNDVSSSSPVDASGNRLSGTARALTVPTFSTTLTFTSPIATSATLYGLTPTGTTLTTSTVSIIIGSITLNVPDYLMILQVTPTPEPGTLGVAVMGASTLFMRRRSRRR